MQSCPARRGLQSSVPRRHPGVVATLKIKTGLTRLRFGLTSLRGGCLDYYLDGEHIGHHNVAIYRPVRVQVAPGEHVLEVRQKGLREGHVRSARLSFAVAAGRPSRLVAQARPARRWWVSSSNPVDDVSLTFRA